MKNMFKSNKKGFTLVELLAVIVILALLIVITANTVLPMMNKSKQNGMLVYAERVLANAATSAQADSLTSSVDGTRYYSIEAITGQNEYFGCVAVKTESGKNTFAIALYDGNNHLKLEGRLKDNTANFSLAADKIVKEWANSTEFDSANYDTDAKCNTASTPPAGYTKVNGFITKTYTTLTAPNQL